MSACAGDYRSGFYRRSDRAVLGGVCAGLASYYGLNVSVLRLVAVILFFAMPPTIVAYIAAVLLLPSRPGERSKRKKRDKRSKRNKCGRRRRRREQRRARREASQTEADANASSPRYSIQDVERQAESLERRLARIEKYVTSSRYNLDREFRNL